MRKHKGVGLNLVHSVAAGVICGTLSSVAFAQSPAAPEAAAQAAPPPGSPPVQPGPPQAAPAPPITPPSTPADLAAGNFGVKKLSGDRYELKVTGSDLKDRQKIEEYMIYRAAEFSLTNQFPWFELIEQRERGDKVEALPRDPEGPRFSFRLENWRPKWRVKSAGTDKWQAWSPFSGAQFPVADGAAAEYEVTAIIVPRKGPNDGVNPLAFEADAVSDFLINQVAPPK